MNLEPAVKPRDPSSSGMLIVATLLVVATTTRWGNFSWEGLVLVLAAAALAVALHLRPDLFNSRSTGPLLGLFLACLATMIVQRSGFYEWTVDDVVRRTSQRNPYASTIKIVVASSMLLALTYLSREAWSARLARHRFIALLLAAVGVRILVFLSSPQPAIDVFQIQMRGAQGLMEGANVYAMSFPDLAGAAGNAAAHYGYPYPPTAYYPAALSWLMFKDVRAAWVACDLLAAFLLYALARRMNPGPPHARFRELLVLAFLFMPKTLYVLECAWTEPLTAAALGGVALALATARSPMLSGVLIGVLLTSKQYVPLCLPPLLKLRRTGRAHWFWAAVTALVLALPFLLWNAGALIDRALVFFLVSPGREDGLSLYAAFLRNGVQLPLWLTALFSLSALALFTWKMPRTPAGWLFATASSWLVFFLLGKQSFMNYFYLIIFALLLAAAATPQPEESGLSCSSSSDTRNRNAG